MQKLQFTITINAPAQKVYETMLGLNNKTTYENWVAVFNPTSTYEGSWTKGSKILFVGFDENGKRAGMVSEVVENDPANYVSVKHVGFVDGDTEVTTGELVEKWSGGHETYRFENNNGSTKLTVELDTIDEYLDFFNTTYPKALQKLKEIVEK